MKHTFMVTSVGITDLNQSFSKALHQRISVISSFAFYPLKGLSFYFYFLKFIQDNRTKLFFNRFMTSDCAFCFYCWTGKRKISVPRNTNHIQSYWKCNADIYINFWRNFLNFWNNFLEWVRFVYIRGIIYYVFTTIKYQSIVLIMQMHS